MKIGMLTTWNSMCGIAEYSRQLIEGYERLDEVERIIVFSNYGNTNSFVRGPKTQIITNCFGVYWWGENAKLYAEEIATIATNNEIDVFHIQYQSSLYEATGFNKLLYLLKEKGIKIVLTQHDSTVNPQHDSSCVDTFIIHKEGITDNPKAVLCPYPIPNTRPSVCSFGMGRNQEKIIEKACERLWIDYSNFDARTSEWFEFKDLISKIKEFDAVVLWYNEVPLVGNSSAARTAIACYRPVIVNNVRWFSDLEREHYHVCDNNRKALEDKLVEVLHLDLTFVNSFNDIGWKHVNKYYI